MDASEAALITMLMMIQTAPSAVRIAPTMMPIFASWFGNPAAFDWLLATTLMIRPTSGATMARIRPTRPSVLPGKSAGAGAGAGAGVGVVMFLIVIGGLRVEAPGRTDLIGATASDGSPNRPGA